MLGTVAAAPVLAVPVIAAAGPDRSAWQRAMAAYFAAKAAEDAFDATTYAEAIAACDRAEAEFDTAWPHSVHEIEGCRISTDRWREVAWLRAEYDGARSVQTGAPGRNREIGAFLEAHDRRKAARDGLPERQHMDAMTSRSDELMDARCDLEECLIQQPAPDLRAATWKLEFARDRWDGDVPNLWTAAILGDLHRLAA